MAQNYFLVLFESMEPAMARVFDFVEEGDYDSRALSWRRILPAVGSELTPTTPHAPGTLFIVAT